MSLQKGTISFLTKFLDISSYLLRNRVAQNVYDEVTRFPLPLFGFFFDQITPFQAKCLQTIYVMVHKTDDTTETMAKFSQMQTIYECYSPAICRNS